MSNLRSKLYSLVWLAPRSSRSAAKPNETHFLCLKPRHSEITNTLLRLGETECHLRHMLHVRCVDVTLNADASDVIMSHPPQPLPGVTPGLAELVL